MKTISFAFCPIASMFVTIIFGFVACALSQSENHRIMNDSATVNKIAFYSGRYGNREICLINIDGTQLLFNTNKDGNYEIYLMNADGSNQQRLTNTTAFEIFPQLSPDGNKIIYARIVMNPFYGEIHIRNLDGSGDVALTQNTRSENPIWSPDGKQIAFQTSRDGILKSMS